ncbi:MerR family transcriptional regulator [Kribbella jiaozuonensis]|uniref:MerR family transcriptional regulator n=1 Tax=Kribbella jiaozuonensis TaxID=2575441 RepID=A0A4U3LUU6_9ACTN|nr:MerR family transcriptional regulator [Kribbella jiaozuonensis]TKK79861.1 MerR family transcriptional regulator [Kribbella jiaozuonensis]
MDHSIGAVARLAGVSVKTVRYYSDLGLLTSRRTTAGHRRYEATAVARLELIRTLRALGLDLETVRAVLERERTLADVLAAHADALAVQIRTLQAQHAVVSVVAHRHSTPEELTDMTAQFEQARQTLIADFLTSTLGDDPALAAARQNLTPVLAPDAQPEQVEAWLELAALASSEDFRAAVRRLTAGYQVLAGDNPLRADPELRARLIDLRRTADPRWHRYVELVAVVNGWAPPSRVAG